MAAYAATVTSPMRKPIKIGSDLVCYRGAVNVTNYNPTLAEITGITGKFKDDPTVLLGGVTDEGYLVTWDESAKAVKAFYPSVAVSPQVENINFTDSDDAASNGVAVYVHVDEVLEDGTYMAHLEFVGPSDADTSFELNDGGPSAQVIDDDNAATGGVALYIDEDASSGAKLLANTGADAYVMASNGHFIKITANGSPSGAGVQVYIDEDASNAYEKLLFVSPTDADAIETTSSSLGMVRDSYSAAPGTEVAADVDVGLVQFTAFGLV